MPVHPNGQCKLEWGVGLSAVRQKGMNLFRFAIFLFVGTAFALAIQYGYSRKFGHSWNRLLHVPEDGGISKLIKEEFAPLQISTGPAHDGIFYYLIARDPWLKRGLTAQAIEAGWMEGWGWI